MKLADVSIRRPVFAVMLIAALLVFGLVTYPRIGVDLFPNVEFPIVSVTVVYPGADPASMESKVADPIEEAVNSMSGIKILRSVNLESVTQVIIQFELSVDREVAAQEVRDRISAIQRNLPTEIEPPVVQKFDVGAAPIMSVALSGKLAPRDLTKLADDVVKERIQRLAGVGSVDSGRRPRPRDPGAGRFREPVRPRTRRRGPRQRAAHAEPRPAGRPRPRGPARVRGEDQG
jgi:HAE1 family hydrophobic/amphiphilic exporter-1